MNLVKSPRRSTIMQYSQPKTYELVGKTLSLIMDSGYDLELNVVSEEICRWCVVGTEPVDSLYHCVKADDTTYFMSVRVSDDENHMYVLDMEQRLVTRQTLTKGLNPKMPYMLKSEFDFGAIDMEGYRLPFKRHFFSVDSLGTHVQWRWGMDHYTKHAYLESDYYRITWDEKGATADSFDESCEIQPATDEPARYVKIKEHMFLFSLIESNNERFLKENQKFRSNNLTLLQNFDKGFQTGYGFGTSLRDGVFKPMFTPLNAFAKPDDIPESFLNYDNPYTV